MRPCVVRGPPRPNPLEEKRRLPAAMLTRSPKCRAGERHAHAAVSFTFSAHAPAPPRPRPLSLPPVPSRGGAATPAALPGGARGHALLAALAVGGCVGHEIPPLTWGGAPGSNRWTAAAGHKRGGGGVHGACPTPSHSPRRVGRGCMEPAPHPITHPALHLWLFVSRQATMCCWRMRPTTHAALCAGCVLGVATAGGGGGWLAQRMVRGASL